MFYLGGDAYSALAILISDGETSKLYYLHRDYLGSIVMLTDENANIAERRHFDPWGHPIKVEDGAGKVLQGLTLLDKGFTGHEHLQTVGLIYMNGRLYDPAYTVSYNLITIFKTPLTHRTLTGMGIA